MTTNLKTLTAAVAAAALLAPVAVAKKPADRPGKAKTERTSKGHAKAKQGIFRGTVSAIGTDDITVDVTGGNKRARELAAGKTVVFDLSAVKKIHVADVNADGSKDLADFTSGDAVQVQARVTKDQDVTQPVAARKVHNKPAQEPEAETETEVAPTE